MSVALCQKCRRENGGKPANGTAECPFSGADILRHVGAGYCPCPAGPKFGDGRIPMDWQSVGLGDTIAKITTAIGIKPCGGCKERQAALNKATRRTPPAQPPRS